MNSSTVKEALNQVIDLFDSKDIRIYLYKKEEDFNALWNFQELSEQVKNQSAIVIVWDAIPEKKRADDVDTSKYLTPADWSVGFSLYLKDNKLPFIKIIIIDTHSNSSSLDSSLSIVPQIMPSVFIPKVNEILSCLCQPIPETKTDMDFIRNIWAARLTRPSEPGDHHALANLIGPLLLLEDIPDLHVKALRNLMDELQLLPRGEKTAPRLTDKSSWINWQEGDWRGKLSNLLKGDKKLNLILIDDMFHLGWGKMLCWAVGAEYTYKGSDCSKDEEPTQIGERGNEIIIKAVSSVERLLKKLKNTGAVKDQRFNFTLDDKESHLEILFLDLRLFPGKEAAEATYFERVIEIAKTLKRGTNDNLPWVGFEDEEIKKVEEWLEDKNRKIEDDRYIVALTLLPRILALTDLSLPIVLFSSTGRRNIVEKLKPYENIITVFDKPKFTVDIPVDIAEQTKKKFKTAFEKAFQILAARQKCKKISEFSYKPEQILNFENKKNIYIELFIDECLEETSERLENLPSDIVFPNPLKDKIYYNANNKYLVFRGEMKEDDRKSLLSLSNESPYHDAINRLFKRSSINDEVYVGGLFAIFTDDISIDNAIKKTDEFDDDLVHGGVRYFDSLGVGAQRQQKGVRAKGTSSANVLNTIMSSFKSKPDFIGFIGLRHLLPQTVEELDLFNPRSADNLFRLTLIALIELFLSETVPAIFGTISKDVLVSIYAGTRIKHYNDATKEKLNDAKFRFGLDSYSIKKNHYLRSIGRDSVYPIVCDIISYHNIHRQIHRVAGIKMAYKSLNTFPEYFICRKCKEIIHINPSLDIKEELESAFKSNVAKVTRFALDRNNKKNAYIMTIEKMGTSFKKAIVFNKAWAGINNANVGDYVTYTNIKITDKGNNAEGVRLLTDTELDEYNKVEKKYSLHEDVRLMCNCVNNGQFSPDYRALHYIADEILKYIKDVYSGNNYGKSIKKILGGFDDVIDTDLKACINASRYLDLGDIVSSIVEVKTNNAHLAANKYKVKPLLFKRIASQLNNLKGEDFCKIAKRINEV